MILRLLTTELRRYFARRLIKVLCLIALGGIAIAGISILLSARPSSPQDAAHSKQALEAAVSECTAYQSSPTGEFPNDIVTAQESCRDRIGSGSINPDDRSAHFTEIWPESDEGGFLVLPIVVFALLALFAGASMTGAEWRFNTLPFMLTWVPQRVTVTIVKIFAIAIASFLASIMLLALFTAAAAPASQWRGNFNGVDASWWANYVGVVLRAGVLAAISGAVGASIAMIGRNTTAAAGAAFAYLAVVENFLPWWKPNWQQWMLNANGATFILGKNLEIHPNEFISPTRAVVVLIAYTAVLATAAALSTRLRDVN